MSLAPRDRRAGACHVLLALGVAGLAPGAAAQTTTATGDAPPPAAATTSPDSPWRGVNFGLTLEGFYQFAATRPPDRVLVLRAYDTRSNTFGLQQAAVVIDAAPDVEAGRRSGARLDLQFGMATETVQGSGANEPRPEVYRHVWQAFGTYVIPPGSRKERRPC